MKTILTEKELGITIQRLSHQLLENHLSYLGSRNHRHSATGNILFRPYRESRSTTDQPEKITYGKLDITFYRDDVRQGLHTTESDGYTFQYGE